MNSFQGCQMCTSSDARCHVCLLVSVTVLSCVCFSVVLFPLPSNLHVTTASIECISWLIQVTTAPTSLHWRTPSTWRRVRVKTTLSRFKTVKCLSLMVICVDRRKLQIYPMRSGNGKFTATAFTCMHCSRHTLLSYMWIRDRERLYLRELTRMIG